VGYESGRTPFSVGEHAVVLDVPVGEQQVEQVLEHKNPPYGWWVRVIIPLVIPTNALFHLLVT